MLIPAHKRFSTPLARLTHVLVTFHSLAWPDPLDIIGWTYDADSASLGIPIICLIPQHVARHNVHLSLFRTQRTQRILGISENPGGSVNFRNCVRYPSNH